MHGLQGVVGSVSCGGLCSRRLPKQAFFMLDFQGVACCVVAVALVNTLTNQLSLRLLIANWQCMCSMLDVGIGIIPHCFVGQLR
jgi:hypothetical protein